MTYQEFIKQQHQVKVYNYCLSDMLDEILPVISDETWFIHRNYQFYSDGEVAVFLVNSITLESEYEQTIKLSDHFTAEQLIINLGENE